MSRGKRLSDCDVRSEAEMLVICELVISCTVGTLQNAVCNCGRSFESRFSWNDGCPFLKSGESVEYLVRRC